MKSKIARFIARFIPQAVYEQLLIIHKKESYEQTSYAQEGEDLLLRQFFSQKRTGFFVDVGAHHPIRFSNTFKLYQMGWRGINIDAMPGSMQVFKQYRPEDINLEFALADKNQELLFYCFDEPAINTFDARKAQLIIDQSSFKLNNTLKIKTETLSAILDKYLPSHTTIDLLNVDAEGFDLKILQGNNWEKYKPGLIVIETGLNHVGKDFSGEVSAYLNELGYSIVAKTYKTAFFKLVAVVG